MQGVVVVEEKNAAAVQFAAALEAYLHMGCTWGMVRSWIGLQLVTDEPSTLPFERGPVQGLDIMILEAFEADEVLRPGALSLNIL